ncbi:MAG TPA: hypothetical protein VI522_05950, partial [Gammaproteobacteria bacterium]|nr:hypothetical protein [Gammaproteobacteria bacterium]
KTDLLKHIAEMESSMSKYMTPSRMRHYCTILALPYEEEESLQQLLTRSRLKLAYDTNQTTFLSALENFASFRVTPDEFKSIYHRAKRAKADKNKSALAQRVKPATIIYKLTELMCYLKLEVPAVSDLDSFQDAMHVLLQAQSILCVEMVKQFTVPGELVLTPIIDYDTHNINNLALKNFLATDPKQHIVLKKQINNWLYLYEAMQQLALYETEKDVTQIERALELVYIEYQEREWGLNAVGAAALNNNGDNLDATRTDDKKSLTLSLFN